MMLKRKSLLKTIPIYLIKPGRYQPREQFDPVALQALAESIRCTHGLLQPIIVRPLDDKHYEIVAGERRYRAAQLAGLSTLPCLLADYSNEQALQAAIIENTHRHNLNPIEEAKAYHRLIEEFDYLHEEVAATVGKSRTTVTNALRLLKLDSSVQNALIQGKLSEGHAKMLAALEKHQQRHLATRCIAKAWNVRQMEHAVKQLQHAKEVSSKRAYSPHHLDPNLQRLEIALSDYLGQAVEVKTNDQKQGASSIHIRFNTLEEFEGFLNRIGFKQD